MPNSSTCFGIYMLTSLLPIFTQEKEKTVSLHRKQLYESADKREYSVGRHPFTREC